MSVLVELPGTRTLSLATLVLDLNGTLARRGELLGGVRERLDALGQRMNLHILTADTFATATPLALELRVALRRVSTGSDKRRLVERLGAERCVAVGNGANDAEMLAAARLGIAILGPDGASAAALRNADVCFRSIREALDALLEPTVLTATMRP